MIVYQTFLAGDHVKFGFPMAWSATTLIWSMIDFADGYGRDRDDAMNSVRWALDYFIKAHVSEDEFYGQVSQASSFNCLYWSICLSISIETKNKLSSHHQ